MMERDTENDGKRYREWCERDTNIKKKREMERETEKDSGGKRHIYKEIERDGK